MQQQVGSTHGDTILKVDIGISDENNVAMASIHINTDAVHVRFTLAEKLAGLLRDIDEPLTRVRAVTVENDGLSAARGVRAPGLALPGRRRIGTWRGRGRRAAVSVRRGQPAVRIALEGSKYSELLIGTPAATEVADRLRSATQVAEG